MDEGTGLGIRGMQGMEGGSEVEGGDTGFEKVCGENPREEDVDEASEGGEEGSGAIVELELAMDRKTCSGYHVRYKERGKNSVEKEFEI